MTEDTSPENLRKFLESDDPAMVRMEFFCKNRFSSRKKETMLILRRGTQR